MDADPLGGQAERGGLGEGRQRRLRRGVGARAGRGQPPAVGGDVDDRAAPALDHGRHHGQGRRDRGEEVDVEGVAEVLLADVDQADTGVLRRVVDRAGRSRPCVAVDLVQGACAGPSVSATSQVIVRDAGECAASSAARASSRCGVAGQPDHRRAGPGQVAAELRAQAGRGAGDDGRPGRRSARRSRAGVPTGEKRVRATPRRRSARGPPGRRPSGPSGPSSAGARAGPPRRPARPGRRRAPPGRRGRAPAPRPARRRDPARRGPWPAASA